MGLLKAVRAVMSQSPPPEPYKPPPIGCAGCGYCFSSASAHSIAHLGDRCLPSHVWEGQLVSIDGVLHLRGADG